MDHWSNHFINSITSKVTFLLLPSIILTLKSARAAETNQQSRVHGLNLKLIPRTEMLIYQLYLNSTILMNFNNLTFISQVSILIPESELKISNQVTYNFQLYLQTCKSKVSWNKLSSIFPEIENPMCNLTPIPRNSQVDWKVIFPSK